VQWIDIDDDGNIKLEELDTLLAKGNVKLVSITGLSNVLGVMPPLKNVIKKAHEAGALVCVDAAQLIAHHKVDVQELNCDFLAFSGHKLYGPTGIGVLYAKRELLEEMPPFLGGGMMIGQVSKEGFTTAEIPAKFEAGTPPIAQAIGLAAAIDWLNQFDWNEIEQHELALLRTAIASLSTVEGLTILGKPQSACISFVIEGIHPHDLTDIIGNTRPNPKLPITNYQICLRAGHHCTQPLHKRLGVAASTRLSLGICTTANDILSAVESIKEATSVFQR
jgi:cysteine desulfurase/selenocysteine lyase